MVDVEPSSSPSPVALAAITLGLAGLAILEVIADSLNIRSLVSRPLILAGGLVLAFVGVVGVSLAYRRRGTLNRSMARLLRRFGPLVSRGRTRWWIIAGLTAIAMPTAILGPWGAVFEAPLVRLFVFWCLSVLMTLWLRAILKDLTLTKALPVSIVSLGTLTYLSSFIPQVSNDMFSLGWSEASRYYYASLFFGKQVYGFWAPLSVLHPTRYLLQSIPFLLPGSPIWLHRLWQVLLWIGITYTAAFLIARRLRLIDRAWRFWIALWLGLFLLQAPVYYHLTLSVIVVVAFVSPEHPWRSAISIILASVWAGASRVNWVPVPAMIAIALYALERDRGDLPLLRYWAVPTLWAGVGLAAGFAGQAGYAAVSGNPPSDFGTAFSSPLLWYRLLPSPTFPMGVLAALVLAAGPLVLWVSRSLSVAVVWARKLRFAAMAAMLIILLVGGVVVSVKIGGGSNLHNLDAFLVLLAICGLYWTLDGRWRSAGRGSAPWWAMTLMAIMPMVFLLQQGAPIHFRDPQAEHAVLSSIRAAAAAPAKDGEPVLFLTERQLLTFGQLPGVRLVPGFEKVTLMEMAMADNQPYLDRFWHDLQQQEFGLIVSEPLSETLQGRSHAFGEENDAWVKRVSRPILCYYKPVFTSSDPPVQLLVPRSPAMSCPEILGEGS